MPLVDMMKLGTSSGGIDLDYTYSHNSGFLIRLGYICQGENPRQWYYARDDFKPKHDEICKCSGVISKFRDTSNEEALWKYVEECIKNDTHPVFDTYKYIMSYINITDQRKESYESFIREIWSVFDELDERGVIYLVNFDNHDEIQGEFYNNRPLKTKTKSAAKIT